VASKEGVERAGSSTFTTQQNALFAEGFSFSGYERNTLYRNIEGERYENLSGISGVDSVLDGRASVFGDFDNDGDTDIFVTNIQGQAHLLYRNNVGQDAGFLRITLEGTKSGRDAFGAVVRVKISSGIRTKVKSGGSGFLSQHDPRLLFGLGGDERVEWIEVDWPAGTTERYDGPLTGSSLKLVEGQRPREVAEVKFSLPDPYSGEERLLARLKIKKGQTFPDLDLVSLEGNSTTLRRYMKPDGKTLVNLWATYCIPCRKEMPELQRLLTEHKDNDLEVVGISLDTQNRGAVGAFLEKYHIQYPNALGAEGIVRQVYSTEEVFIPLTFVLDEKGIVIDIFTSWSTDTRAAVKRLLR